MRHVRDIRLIIALIIVFVWAVSFLADIVLDPYTPRYEITPVVMGVVVWLFKPPKGGEK